MHDGDIPDAPFGLYLSGNLGELLFRHRRVGVVFEVKHPFTLGVVPDRAQERDDGAVRVFLHAGDDGLDIDRSGCNLDHLSLRSPAG